MPLSVLPLTLAINQAHFTAMLASDALERVERLHRTLLGPRGHDGCLAQQGLAPDVAGELARTIAKQALSEDELANVSSYLAADAIAHGPWVLRSGDHVGDECAELLDLVPHVDDAWSDDPEDWSLLALLLTARGPGLAQEFTGSPAVYQAQQKAIARIAEQYRVEPAHVVRALK